MGIVEIVPVKGDVECATRNGLAELLGQIARKTGGISVTPAGIDSVLSRLKPQIESERREENLYLALNPFLPFLAVLLLAIEWAIRKQRGMI